MQQVILQAPHMSSPIFRRPSCEMEKNESPVRMERSLSSQSEISRSWAGPSFKASQLSRARPEGRNRETRRLAPRDSASFLSRRSCEKLREVTTVLMERGIFLLDRSSIPLMIFWNVPWPRMRSLTSGVAPSRLTCTLTSGLPVQSSIASSVSAVPLVLTQVTMPFVWI